MSTPPTLSYRPDIQGLRAIAIMLVVLAHAGFTFFSGGFVGVDVFFVLSGYLITGLLVREHTQTEGIQLARFISQRLKRLLPMLLVMISLVILIAPLLISNYEFKQQTASAVYASSWTSNLFFAFSELDYFAEVQTRDLFLHTWSLGVEEQFYLAWPLLLLVTLTLLTRQLGRGKHHSPLLLVLSILFVGSLGLSWYWSATQPLWSFYLMPSRIWQFALGAAVFVWFDSRHQHNSHSLKPIWSIGCGIIGITLIIGSAVLLHSNMTYPGFWALLPSLGAALIILAGNQGNTLGISRGLSHPILVWIGDHSYSWYIWHWPVLILGFALGLQRPIEAIGLIAFSLLLAILSYRWVELPFWKGRLSKLSPAQGIIVSILAILMVASGALNYSKFIVHNDNEGGVQFVNAARHDKPVIYKYGCDAWYYNAEVRPCLIGSPGAPKTVVLLGDSIGAQWFSLLPEIFKTPDWRIVVLTKSSCALIDQDYFYRRIGKIYTVCSEWRNATLDYLKSLQPDIIFVGNDATYKFSKNQWIDGSRRVLARLNAAADHIIVIPGIPQLSFDGPSCLEALHAETALKRFLSNSQTCREALTTTQTSDVAHYLELAVQDFPKARLLNLNDMVCPNRHCAAKSSDGLVIFRDQLHLTDSFVRAQAPKVLLKLEELGLGPLLAD